MLWSWTENLKKSLHTNEVLLTPPIFKHNGHRCFWNNSIEALSTKLRDPRFSHELTLSKAVLNLPNPQQNLDMLIIHDHLASSYHEKALTHYKDWFGANKTRLLETMEACLKLDPDYYIPHLNDKLYDTKSFLYQVLKTHRYAAGSYFSGPTAAELIDARNLVISHQHPVLTNTFAPGKTK